MRPMRVPLLAIQINRKLVVFDLKLEGSHSINMIRENGVKAVE